ncbi:conserved hypothetical protein [Geotrichum candidum]|uniref:Cohesin loading factor n=1 Tax=Geotrichum candidum TaxID=1173061 RepID=A0A0J9XDK5_GEOCN|nr:conserved hypothetical protein [Geotrichum candidum]
MNTDINTDNTLNFQRFSSLHLTFFPLANEFLRTAHTMSWGLVSGVHDITMYHKLVSAAIGCLLAILREPNLPAHVEIQTRLKLASLLIEETENATEADSVLAKGLAVAVKSNHHALTLRLKYATVLAMARSSQRGALRLLDSTLEEAAMVGVSAIDTIYSLQILRISILLASAGDGTNNNVGDYTRGIQELVNLENQREVQKQVAALAYVMHALKLIQAGKTTEASALLISVTEIEQQVSMDMTYNTSQSVIFPIAIQIAFLRVISQIIIALQTAQFGFVDSGLLVELNNLTSSDMFNDGSWSNTGLFLLPLASLPNGNSGPASSTLSINWLSLVEARILASLVTGIAKLRSAPEDDARVARQHLQHALEMVRSELQWKSATPEQQQRGEYPETPLLSLAAAKAHKDQLRLLQCYTLFYLAIESFMLSQWTDSGNLQELLQTAQLLPPELNEQFLPLTFYLSGVFFQASGNVHNAIQFFLKIRSHVRSERNELYLLATINLVSLLEAPEQRSYNTFKMVPIEDHNNSTGTTTPSGYFRAQLKRLLIEADYPNPMLKWAYELLDYAYEVLPRGEEVPIQNKLSALLKYAMTLNCFQLGSIVAYLGAPRAEPVERRLALAQKGLNDAFRTHDAVWSWMNGLFLEEQLRVRGDAQTAQLQAQHNRQFKTLVESRLNRVD